MGSQILRSKAPSALAKPSAPNYHALVTPVLHRRFVRASWTTLIIAYVGNILMENVSSWPWSAIPLGRSAINTLTLFFFLMPILVLRIAQLSTTSNKGLSDVHCLIRSITDCTLLRCTIWYTLSAWLVIQFYIWNALPSSDLSLLTKAISYEPYCLNERPIYLGFYAIPLGIIQAIIHVWTDRDYLKLQDEEKTVWQAFSEAAIRSLQRICTTIIVSIASGPIVYWVLRAFVCRTSYTIVGSFVRIHPDARPQSLSNKVDLLFRSVWLTVLLVIAWEATNIAFTLEFTKSPIREGKVISDTSSDPNGSLILGLRLKKKPLSRRLAFKELKFIATEKKPRRETIFADLTKPTPALKQLLAECRDVIGVIITKFTPPEQPSNALVIKPQSPGKDIKDFSPQQPLDENVLRTPPKNGVIGKWQATPGNMPSSPINLDSIKTHIAKKEVIESRVYEFLTPLLDSTYGDIFRMTVQRKTTALFPDASLQIDAIVALAGFVCASLDEDIYGMVQKDLPSLLEEFTNIASALEGYMSNPQPHWTDVHSKTLLELHDPSVNKQLFPEATALLDAVNTGLQKIGDAFEPYLPGMELSTDARRKIRSVRKTAKDPSH
ncbi:hypothetical protein DRE_05074 [Drechslerella stenobrocha 248]|uniref:Nucleoporin NDC1 n=1 Tax=Drechslerella stenobrocha 248 TaxID=1043628 RepID=W7HZT4_9PEZI|nr:hypothetical protein DRE_05074 [Drechslerella stenobrocha 248]